MPMVVDLGLAGSLNDCTENAPAADTDSTELAASTLTSRALRVVTFLTSALVARSRTLTAASPATVMPNLPVAALTDAAIELEPAPASSSASAPPSPSLAEAAAVPPVDVLVAAAFGSAAGAAAAVVELAALVVLDMPEEASWESVASSSASGLVPPIAAANANDRLPPVCAALTSTSCLASTLVAPSIEAIVFSSIRLTPTLAPMPTFSAWTTPPATFQLEK